MSPANQYKKLENKVYLDAAKLFRTVGKVFTGFFKKIVQTGKQRFTIMLIPHSEKKIFNFKLSLFSMIFLGILLTGILGTFLVFTTQFTGLNKLLTAKSAGLESSEASLEAIRDEMYNLKKTATKFIGELNETRSSVGFQDANANLDSSSDGDFASFFNMQEHDEGLMKELSELRNLSDSMLDSIDTLKDISKLQESTRKLLADLPTYWPVQGRIRITNNFGFSEHPISGITYLHKGIDLAKSPGVDIFAAANGKVIEQKFDQGGFGNYIIVRHKAGFSTKYAHLAKTLVRAGDTVVQGQKIGTMGKTGLSTGYHLHFEVRLGSQVRDPLIYLRMRDSVNLGSNP